MNENATFRMCSSGGMEKKKYPVGPESYTLYEEVGHGVSASVHRALCVPLNEIVAIKILDLERRNSDLNNISREAQTMMLVDHPNILKSHCSFVSDHTLWVVMPFMSGGSCLHILKATHPDGFEEVVIATILRGVLRGLEYLHNHGHIHRDVKAGNVLIDGCGAIKLGDFGVSAFLFDSGDRQRVRNTFVGTPCWMAPEVMEQLHGYDFKADIWSFGITALELAHGHAPFSKFPPLKVLLMTLQNAPPGLDYERDKKFSKSFRQMIASCLVKEPSKRPTTTKLLRHHFFKQARSNEYIARKLLEGLPVLGDRIMELKKKEEYMVSQKKTPDGKMEEISQNEYKRGISGWDFNFDDVKVQGSMDEQELVPSRDQELVSCHPTPIFDTIMNNEKAKPGRSDDESTITNSSGENYRPQSSSPHHIELVEKHVGEKGDEEIQGRFSECLHSDNGKQHLSDIHLPETTGCLHICVSDKQQNHALGDASSYLFARVSRPSGNIEETEENNKIPVVQRKGRFKVTSENIDLEKVSPSRVLQKSQSLQALGNHPGIPHAPPTDATAAHLGFIFPDLHSVLQTNLVQRESILSLMKHLSTGELTGVERNPHTVAASEKSMLEAAHDREKEYLHEIAELQWRLLCAQEELQKYRTQKS